MRVNEIMSTHVKTVPVTASADAAWEMMRGDRIHHLVVMDGNKVAGVFSARDAGGVNGAADPRRSPGRRAHERARGDGREEYAAETGREPDARPYHWQRRGGRQRQAGWDRHHVGSAGPAGPRRHSADAGVEASAAQLSSATYQAPPRVWGVVSQPRARSRRCLNLFSRKCASRSRSPMCVAMALISAWSRGRMRSSSTRTRRVAC